MGPDDAHPRVTLDRVSVRYGDVEAVADMSFSVEEGEFVTLIGPSGCGKSSILRTIGGLLRPAAGRIEVNGRPVVGPSPEEIAYVFQDLALFPWRSAVRNVEVPLELRGVGRAERRSRALQALDTVGLGDVPDRFPSQLSGGMRQRVAIARALVSDAHILLFDEPFAAVDEHARMLLGMELMRLLEEHGKTVVFVTHSLTEAAYLSDRIVVMSKRPARVAKVIDVEIDRPRVPSMMKTPEFHRLADQLFALLFDEAAQTEPVRA